jgi:hypothetical protein
MRGCPTISRLFAKGWDPQAFPRNVSLSRVPQVRRTTANLGDVAGGAAFEQPQPLQPWVCPVPRLTHPE